MTTEKTNQPVPEEQFSQAEDTIGTLPQQDSVPQSNDDPIIDTELSKIEENSENTASSETTTRPDDAVSQQLTPAPEITDGKEHAAGQLETMPEPRADIVSEPTDCEPESGTAEVQRQPESQLETAAAETETSEETVDFSDEEAELAAEMPEYELDEHQSDEEEAPSAELLSDLTGKTKEELLDVFAVLLSSKPIQNLRRDVEAIKVAFYKLHRADEDAARKAFIESGGEPEEFAADSDRSEQRLKDLFSEYRKRRDEYIAGLERTKEDNLKVKLAIIEELKDLVGSSETLNNTFNSFRELQQRWKDAGPVPQANVKDLWETYNHHVENFYSFIKINKELRDLDLKKNYEAKIALCEEAEALLLEPSIVNSFHKLQKLHEQWRETGPVSKEYKESLWDRFREASSRINKQHQDYFEKLKEEQKKNLELKTELCIKTEELTDDVLTTRKDWNKASDKLLEIQKVWKTIGFAPKKDNAKIYERFRNACDRFFEQKRNFYVQIKTEMDHNLQLKNEICEAAEAVKDSDDWKKTTDELIALQKKWKEIGPVARRHSDAVWKRFRSACDHFFNRKSTHFSSMDAEYDENLRKKRELLAEIEQCDIMEGGFEAIKEYQRRWSEIGFVPIKEKDAIHKEYKAVMDKMFSMLRGSEQSRQINRFRDKVTNMKGSGDRRLRTERDRLYNKVKQLEADIALLENNIGFFSKSKNAEAMIRDVREKIDRAKEEMAATIEKVNMIDNEI